MRIDIALRLKPFSHLPGTICVIPGTDVRVRVFPSRFYLFQADGAFHEERIDIQGPVRGFTVEVDLEKQQTSVFGSDKRGFFHYYLKASKNGFIQQVFDKGPSKILPIKSLGQVVLYEEKLSLGIHKHQKWEAIRERCDLREIFPFWLQCGQNTPKHFLSKESKGSLQLLRECEGLYSARERVFLKERLQHLVAVGFEGILNPRLHDPEYQGIISDEVVEDPCASLALLSQGAELIRNLFFVEMEGRWSILPCLLPQFVSGRFIKVKTMKEELLDIEWSNGVLRRLKITPTNTRRIELILPKELKGFRLRENMAEKGSMCHSTASLFLEEGKPLFLDRFQK